MSTVPFTLDKTSALDYSIKGTKPRQNLQAIMGLVVHVSDGPSLPSCFWAFKGAQNSTIEVKEDGVKVTRERRAGEYVSSHFGISRGDKETQDGDVWQFVPIEQKAIAQDGATDRWFSVENVGYCLRTDDIQSQNRLTFQQVRSLAALLLWLNENYSVPLQISKDQQTQGLGYHQTFTVSPRLEADGRLTQAPTGSHYYCPGPPVIAQLPRVIELAQCGLNSSDLSRKDSVVEVFRLPPTPVTPLNQPWKVIDVHDSDAFGLPFFLVMPSYLSKLTADQQKQEDQKRMLVKAFGFLPAGF